MKIQEHFTFKDILGSFNPFCILYDLLSCIKVGVNEVRYIVDGPLDKLALLYAATSSPSIGLPLGGYESKANLSLKLSDRPRRLCKL